MTLISMKTGRRPWSVNLQLQLQVETGPTFEEIDGRRRFDRGYIYTFTSDWVYRARILTSHWLCGCLGHGAGSEVMLLIGAQVMLTLLPVLLSSTIVGETGHSHCHQQKVCLPLHPALPPHRDTHTHRHIFTFSSHHSHDPFFTFCLISFLIFFLLPFCSVVWFRFELLCISPPCSLSFSWSLL